MRIRNFGPALVLLTALAVPSFARAQGARTARAAWASPDFLLTHQEALQLTPGQVQKLALLSSQVERHEQGLRRAPSKPWVAVTLGTAPEEASRQVVALLSADQRVLAQRLWPGTGKGASI